MEQITFIIKNKKDRNLLIMLADRLGIKGYFRKDETQVVAKDEREKYLKIIRAGVDVLNFGDPSEWQQKTRKDRLLPQREK